MGQQKWLWDHPWALYIFLEAQHQSLLSLCCLRYSRTNSFFSSPVSVTFIEVDFTSPLKPAKYLLSFFLDPISFLFLMLTYSQETDFLWTSLTKQLIHFRLLHELRRSDIEKSEYLLHQRKNSHANGFLCDRGAYDVMSNQVILI
jgi:hypothetical protein